MIDYALSGAGKPPKEGAKNIFDMYCRHGVLSLAISTCPSCKCEPDQIVYHEIDTMRGNPGINVRLAGADSSVVGTLAICR